MFGRIHAVPNLILIYQHSRPNLPTAYLSFGRSLGQNNMKYSQVVEVNQLLELKVSAHSFHCFIIRLHPPLCATLLLRFMAAS